ncbi:hypothetical protein NE237_030103 [Protea cynaroides]|uniref:Uncharacterized protein n=1 Tax=Protea cynaroides TaxID=273540 RepID=A0A9Q0GSD9_9MAGN|nr:hypothetical protein NE237_030103 [Protea cynaroides]
MQGKFLRPSNASNQGSFRDNPSGSFRDNPSSPFISIKFLILAGSPNLLDPSSEPNPNSLTVPPNHVPIPATIPVLLRENSLPLASHAILLSVSQDDLINPSPSTESYCLNPTNPLIIQSPSVVLSTHRTHDLSNSLDVTSQYILMGESNQPLVSCSVLAAFSGCLQPIPSEFISSFQYWWSSVVSPSSWPFTKP